jgi:hypothetical protein
MSKSTRWSAGVKDGVARLPVYSARRSALIGPQSSWGVGRIGNPMSRVRLLVHLVG